MAHEEIHHELAECQASGEFVAYHKWGDDPSIFLVGVVRALTPTKATFQDVMVGGRFESEPHGVPLRLIHTVHRGTQYLWRLRVLHELGPLETVEERVARTRHEVRALLEDAARTRSIVRIWTAAEEASDYLILTLDEETVLTSNANGGGPADGRYRIRLRRIVKARIGAAEIDDARVHRYGVEHGFPSA